MDKALLDRKIIELLRDVSNYTYFNGYRWEWPFYDRATELLDKLSEICNGETE